MKVLDFKRAKLSLFFNSFIFILWKENSKVYILTFKIKKYTYSTLTNHVQNSLVCRLWQKLTNATLSTDGVTGQNNDRTLVWYKSQRAVQTSQKVPQWPVAPFFKGVPVPYLYLRSSAVRLFGVRSWKLWNRVQWTILNDKEWGMMSRRETNKFAQTESWLKSFQIFVLKNFVDIYFGITLHQSHFSKKSFKDLC